MQEVEQSKSKEGRKMVRKFPAFIRLDISPQRYEKHTITPALTQFNPIRTLTYYFYTI
jgi:hypothetical protein